MKANGAQIADVSVVVATDRQEDGLLRRMDYNIEIAGNTPGAHYVRDYVEVAGIKFPTRRRIYPRQADGSSLSESLVVSIDLTGIKLS